MVLLAALLPMGIAVAEPAPQPTERDYLDDLPISSVSRLPQPLDEVPGAVTVIDRNTIRRSGARELYDVLRLVPGFLTTRLDGGNPLGNYHADFDDMNRRMQIFVDGRSVYSTVYIGNVGMGSLGVVLEDIERIEVLRGSNSAAYGTNAFMGVVNIVTAHASDTRGTLVSANEGGNGVADRLARFGWSDDAASYRMTFSRRKDKGATNQNDDRLVEQAHFRGDLQLSGREDLLLETGAVQLKGGTGTPGDDGDPARTEQLNSNYLLAQWRRQISDTEEVKLFGSLDEERFRGSHRYYPLSSDGLGRRLALSGQYSTAVNDALRLVGGTEYRYEYANSSDLFYDQGPQSNHFWHWFGNVEWRLHPQWVFNAGGLFEHHSITGSRTSPRFMLNFHATPDHTVRAGTTTAYRVPTLFELRGNWQKDGVDTGGHVFHPYRFVHATGGAKPERLDVAEAGYLGEFRALHLGVDVRAFNELARSRLRYYGLKKDPVGPGPTNLSANDYINKSPTKQRGWEAQLRWKPVADTQVIVNHTSLRILDVDPDTADDVSGPSHYSMLMLMQRLPDDYDLTVIFWTADKMTWSRRKDMLPPSRQTDLRLARKFQIGSTRGEVAVTGQLVDGGHVEYAPDRSIDRRTFVSVRLEY